MLIGLSASRCCIDMAMGKVDHRNVRKIIARTRIATREELEEVITDYKKYEWQFAYDASGEWVKTDEGARERAASYMRAFYAEGRVEQPRLEDKPIPSIDAPPRPHWITHESEIVWEEQEM